MVGGASRHEPIGSSTGTLRRGMGATRRERRRRVRRWRRAILGIALAILVIGGVAAAGVLLRDRDDGRAGGRARRTSAPTSPTTATTTTLPPPTARGPLGSEQPVSFAFGGDVHFEGDLRSKLLANPESVLESIAPVLSAPDVAVVNLESAVTVGGTAQDKQYVFRAPAVALTALAAAGVDTATAANNHG